MSPTQARAFHAVATAGSFTAAARKLGVSQPTITTQVKELETHYGVELFHRHGRGVRLTATGHELLAFVHRMQQHQQDAIGYLQAVQGLSTGALRIGTYSPHDAIDLVAALQRRHPGLDLSVSFGNSRQLEAGLIDHHLDVAVFGCRGQRAEFHVLPYRRPRLVVVVGRTHPWSRRRSVSLRELADQPLVVREPGSEARRAFEEASERLGVLPRTAIEIASREGVLAAVARGMGAAVIFDEGPIPPDLVAKVAIRGAPIVTEVDVVCLAERRTNRIIAAFFDLAQAMRPMRP
ncbi:MAG: LysR family transcriptional regulator [Alphaproteobacteria bacterium]|nr:LysR family transcriptional regulator [Alphaproteobacteria bacterium]